MNIKECEFKIENSVKCCYFNEKPKLRTLKKKLNHRILLNRPSIPGCSEI